MARENLSEAEIMELKVLCLQWKKAYPIKADGEARNAGTEATDWCIQLADKCFNLLLTVERLKELSKEGGVNQDWFNKKLEEFEKHVEKQC